jgi:catechol 2,3-dioxygenase-like lactoylglutathione lyase family enzyme
MEDGPSQVKGAPPRSGWARMVVELHVNDLGRSLSFWRDVLGFQTAFERAEERFAYLEHPEGHQIMLCQRHGRFETGRLDQPLGQGGRIQERDGKLYATPTATEQAHATA